MPLDSFFDATVGDDAVEFAFTVTNAGTDPVELTFRSGLVADFVVRDGDRVVWRWSDDRLFTQALQAEALAPDDAITRTATWAEPQSGDYTVTATLEAERVDLAARTTFTV